MKPEEALNQLEMCALGYCDKCVHNGDDCRERIKNNVRFIKAEFIRLMSENEIEDGSYMNWPE